MLMFRMHITRTIPKIDGIPQIRWTSKGNQNQSYFVARRREADLWCAFRIQGSADIIDAPTTMMVSAPIAKADLKNFPCSIGIMASWKNNQMKPEVAHPECIPPRCCNTDVHARRNSNGGHLKSSWELNSKSKITQSLPSQKMCSRTGIGIVQKVHFASGSP